VPVERQIAVNRIREGANALVLAMRIAGYRFKFHVDKHGMDQHIQQGIITHVGTLLHGELGF